MSQRNYNNVTTIGTLSAPLASSATSVATVGFTGFPTAPFTVTLDRNTATEEICLVTSVAGSTLTLTRGYDGTAGIAHTAGATIEHTAGAIEYREANVHVNATAGVHGTTGNLVGDQGAQSIFDKTLVSPVAQADVTAGDAVVAFDPTGVRNLFRGINSNGDDVITVDTNGGIHAPTAAVTGAASVAGVLTANGGITVPAGKAVTANGGVSATTVAASGALSGASVAVSGAVSGAAISGTTVTGSGLVKGAGVESTAGVSLAQIAAPAGVASKGQVWAQSDGGLYTRAGATNPAARVPVHWGSGTAFPTSGMLDGDFFRRTDLANNTFRYNGGTSAWENGSTTTFPIVRAHANAAQGGLSTGFNTIICQVADIDTASGYSTGTGLFTVPAGHAGTYAVEGKVCFPGAGAGILDSRLIKNGTAVPFTHGVAFQTTSGYGVTTGRQILNLAAGDTIGYQGGNTAGGWATNWNSDDACWLTIERIR